MTRPTVKEVYDYRAYVDQVLQYFLEEMEISGKLEETIEIGWNHEQQHQELLLTDVKYILGHQPLFPSYKENFTLVDTRSEEHTSELQSRGHLVCRLLLEKKNEIYDVD